MIFGSFDPAAALLVGAFLSSPRAPLMLPDSRIRLTATEALALLPDGAGPVHTCLSGIGARRTRDRIAMDIAGARDLAIAGAVARACGTGLEIYTADRDILFVETDRGRTEALVAARAALALQAAE